jgi:predicted permease
VNSPEFRLRVFVARLRGFLGGHQPDAEFNDEIREHLQLLSERFVAQGMSRQEATAAARRQFGNTTLLQEDHRGLQTLPWLEALWQDLRYGLRMLLKAPAFTAVAVLTLAVGVGATTAIFSVVNGVFQRGLPAREPSQLVGLLFHQENNPAQSGFSYPDFIDLREGASCFSGLFAYRIELDGLQEGNHAEQVLTSFVTGGYFTTLGLEPAVGRLILPTEGRVPGSDPVMVLGYSYWRNRFGSDPSIVGRQVLVDGHAVTVVGVAPQHFRGLFSVVDIQAYLPMNMFSIEDRDRGWVNDRTSRSLHVMGRLKPDANLKQAQASLDVVASRLAHQYPKDWRDADLETFPGEAANTLYEPSRHAYRLERVAAGLFLGLSGLVLLVACSNVANLLLVRAASRDQEIAVRAALGASRLRLTRQLLAENLVLALFAGTAGMALGAAGSRALSAIQLNVGIPIRLNLSLDWRVSAFTFICALAACIVVGIVPTLRAYRADPSLSLHGSGRTLASGRPYLRTILVVGQLAASMVLLVVAGLFVRSLQEVSRVTLGFDPHQVLNISMDAHEIGYNKNEGRAFYKDLAERVGELSGVRSASLAFSFPTGEYTDSERVYAEGRLLRHGQAGPRVFDNSVSPGYFQTLSIPIIQGRAFEGTDNQSAPRVAVINEAMAREFWPNESPIGRRFRLSSESDRWIQVVGVAKNTRVLDLITEATPPYFYLPLDQNYSELVTLQVRTTGPPEGMASIIEAQIHALAPGLPLFGVQTMDQALRGPKGLFAYELGSDLGTVLGIVGLFLSLIGLYGVVSCSMAERRREIGIRMALGARPRDIRRMALEEGIGIVAAGTLAGLLASLFVTSGLKHLVFGIDTHDPFTFSAVAFALSSVAVLACYIPAHRAARADPVVALRYD